METTLIPGVEVVKTKSADGTTITANAIPIAKIFMDMEFNSRQQELNPSKVSGLAGDIRDKTTESFGGLISPVVISDIPESRKQFAPPGAEHWLVCGYRRTMAFQVLERETIPAIYIPHLTELDARFMNLAENLMREDLNFGQESKAIIPLLAETKNEEEIGRKLGKSRGWVQVRRMFLGLPEDMRRKFLEDEGLVSQHQIRDLSNVLGTAGPEAARREMALMIDAKLGGKTPRRVNTERKKLGNKSIRTKGEIEQMQTHIREAIGNGHLTVILGWTIGVVTNAEVAAVILQEANTLGKFYNPSAMEVLDGDKSTEGKGDVGTTQNAPEGAGESVGEVGTPSN